MFLSYKFWLISLLWSHSKQRSRFIVSGMQFQSLFFFFFFFFFFRPNRIIANQQNYALHLLLYPQSLLLTGWCSVVLFSVLIEKRRVRGFSYAWTLTWKKTLKATQRAFFFSQATCHSYQHGTRTLKLTQLNLNSWFISHVCHDICSCRHI